MLSTTRPLLSMSNTLKQMFFSENFHCLNSFLSNVLIYVILYFKSWQEDLRSYWGCSIFNRYETFSSLGHQSHVDSHQELASWQSGTLLPEHLEPRPLTLDPRLLSSAQLSTTASNLEVGILISAPSNPAVHAQVRTGYQWSSLPADLEPWPHPEAITFASSLSQSSSIYLHAVLLLKDYY